MKEKCNSCIWFDSIDGEPFCLEACLTTESITDEECSDMYERSNFSYATEGEEEDDRS